MKKILLVFLAIGCVVLPGTAAAQFHGEVYFSLPMPVGDFSDTAKPGFGGGAGLYFAMPQFRNLQLGAQAGYNWFGLEDPADGNWSIIELVPTARIFFRDYDDTFNVFNVYLQLGAGAFIWDFDPDVGPGDDGTDFGFSVGLGATGRFTDRWSFFIQPKFTWVRTEGDNVTYIPLNLGITF
jgi:hypothetical protein